MKNKMMKGAHLSEKKCKEMIRLFCDDLTATQIADVTGVSRVTVNNYLKLIRTHIAKYCEEHNPLYRLAGAFAFMPVHLSAVAVVMDEGLPDDMGWLYGVARHEEKLHLDLLSRQEYEWLGQLPDARGYGYTELVAEKLSRYVARVDIAGWVLGRLAGAPMRVIQESDEIDLFWSMAKGRLAKFRGLNKNTAYLHVKECEFRYNNRNEDLFKILSNIIQRKPLHFSKPAAAVE